jgi:hypothetical protein
MPTVTKILVTPPPPPMPEPRFQMDLTKEEAEFILTVMYAVSSPDRMIAAEVCDALKAAGVPRGETFKLKPNTSVVHVNRVNR